MAGYQIDLRTASELSILYGESHRRYHNFNHIMKLLAMSDSYYTDKKKRVGNAVCERYGQPWKNILPVMRYSTDMMIWFHDAVYNPYYSAGLNEAYSAKLWDDYHGRNEVVFPQQAAIIHDGILLSAEHLKTHEGLEESQEVFLDCDLHGLGSDYAEFLTVGNQIRQEYAHVDIDVFLENRGKFMVAMLKRERIFYTDYFHSKFEARARENLQRWVSDYVTSGNTGISE